MIYIKDDCFPCVLCEEVPVDVMFMIPARRPVSASGLGPETDEELAQRTIVIKDIGDN